MTHGETSAILFSALASLHGLSPRDAELLERSVAGRRFILAVHPYAAAERALMRVALADLAENEAIMVEAAASFVADIPFEDDAVWGTLGAYDRRHTIWFVAIQRPSACQVGSDRSGYGHALAHDVGSPAGSSLNLARPAHQRERRIGSIAVGFIGQNQ